MSMPLTGPKPYNLERFHELKAILTMEPPPLIWDVEEIVARNERVMLYGEFASLKSWLLMSMSLSFATGKPWLGRFATTPRSVLYLDEENNKFTAIRRLQRLYTGLGSPELLKPIQIASRLGIRASQDFPVRLRATLDALSFKPDIIIMETLRRVLVGPENKQDAISEFWNVITEAIGDDMSVIVAHHMRKPNANNPDEDNRDRASGNTDIIAGGDVGFAVERIQAGNVRIECVKSRETEELSPFYVQLVAPDQTGPAHLIIHDNAKATKETIVFNLIAQQPNKQIHTHILETLCKAEGISRASMFRYLDTLETEGKLQNLQHGLWKVIQSTETKGKGQSLTTIVPPINI